MAVYETKKCLKIYQTCHFFQNLTHYGYISESAMLNEESACRGLTTFTRLLSTYPGFTIILFQKLCTEIHLVYCHP